MMEKIIIGIDPGTQILGYSLLAAEEAQRTPRLLVMDVLYLKKIGDPKRRLSKIFESTLRLIDTYHPDHLAIEAPFFGKNVQSALKLGRAQGVAIAAALARSLSYSEYEPATVKQCVTGNGNASKEQVAAVMKSIMGFADDPAYYDATDALAIAYCCFMDLCDPMGELRSRLRPARRRPAKKQQWADYLQQHPDLL